MKKFLTLCVLFSMLLFVAPALIADVNEIDLASNLSFTFEPSSMTKTSLIIIPFAEFDFNLAQEKSVEKKKESDLPMIFGIWAMLVVQFAVLY